MSTGLVLLPAIAGAVAAVIYLARKGWALGKWCVRAARGIEAVHRLIDHELKPNGGGSLHDKITRTDKVAQATAKALDEHLVVAQQDSDRLSAVERHLGL